MCVCYKEPQFVWSSKLNASIITKREMSKIKKTLYNNHCEQKEWQKSVEKIHERKQS